MNIKQLYNDINIVKEAINNNDTDDAMNMLTEIQEELLLLDLMDDFSE